MRHFTLILFATLFLVGCSSTTITSTNDAGILEPTAQWGLLPLTNNTKTPDAGKRATMMTAGLLRAHAICPVLVYQPETSCKQQLRCPDQPLSQRKIAAWAATNNIRYAFTGSVNEWRYKVGLDGEPVVGLTLQVHDLLQNNHVVWTTVGSRTGSSRSGLSNTAQVLLNRMINKFRYSQQSF